MRPGLLRLPSVLAGWAGDTRVELIDVSCIDDEEGVSRDGGGTRAPVHHRGKIRSLLPAAGSCSQEHASSIIANSSHQKDAVLQSGTGRPLSPRGQVFDQTRPPGAVLQNPTFFQDIIAIRTSAAGSDPRSWFLSEKSGVVLEDSIQVWHTAAFRVKNSRAEIPGVGLATSA